MSIETIKNRLVEIEMSDAIGMRKAYPEMPPSINANVLPASVNFARDATYTYTPGYSGDSVMVTEARDYLVRLYIMSAQGGISGEAERACYPYMEKVPTAFMARQSLENLSYIQSVLVVRDSGIIVVSAQNEAFVGLEYVLRITSIYDVQLVDYPQGV